MVIFRLSPTIHFRKFLDLRKWDFRKILHVRRGQGPLATYVEIATLRFSDFEGGGGEKNILTPNISAPLSLGPPIFTRCR